MQKPHWWPQLTGLWEGRCGLVVEQPWGGPCLRTMTRCTCLGMSGCATQGTQLVPVVGSGPALGGSPGKRLSPADGVVADTGPRGGVPSSSGGSYWGSLWWAAFQLLGLHPLHCGLRNSPQHGFQLALQTAEMMGLGPAPQEQWGPARADAVHVTLLRQLP